MQQLKYSTVIATLTLCWESSLTVNSEEEKKITDSFRSETMNITEFKIISEYNASLRMLGKKYRQDGGKKMKAKLALL